MDQARQALDELILKRKVNYASISRLLGRNPAYIQQYIRRGSPKHLDDADRSVLAQFFGVDEEVLGAPSRRGNPAIELVQVPVMNVHASAGHGALAEGEAQSGQFGFSKGWLRELNASNSSSLSAIGVVGNSMEPTLYDGDDIVIDLGDAQTRLRDGIYALRMDGALNVKRIAIEPKGRLVSVTSDNQAYPSWHGLDRRSISVVGRMRCIIRKVK
jgi:phage repressor protein C with HTH and peptisase S24 domain